MPTEKPLMSFPTKKTGLVVAINSIAIETNAIIKEISKVYRRPIQSAICPVTRHARTLLMIVRTLLPIVNTHTYEADGAPLNALCHPAGRTYWPDPLGNSKPKSFLNCGIPTTAPEAWVSKATRTIVQQAYRDQKQAHGLVLIDCQTVASWSSKSVACAATCCESLSWPSMCSTPGLEVFLSSEVAILLWGTRCGVQSLAEIWGFLHLGKYLWVFMPITPM